ncbi:glucose-6-phosphate isomerase [Arthrobacter pityocampae]|uniref:Glucose-6-phosphate isomerase n=1 Tax=Arthrobacter pityocampae TaxID=547334 RepID=A0A2S5IZP2_9MICC|nr:glucose-6-phosphate isomerase [Arthrobacter pityocampae]PPB50029.1 glucose-6-phosphate isomerase [Arthrobacter pityocampae]
MGSFALTATGAALAAVESAVPALVKDRFASRLMAKDATLWGADAESEASVRLGWIDLFEGSRALLPEIAALRADLAAEGVDRIVLCGMGGSSLAPEVITREAGVPLVVLDATDPDQVRAALEEDLQRTAIVVSSKSGSTVETDSQRRVFEQAFTDAGIDAASRIIVVTDPGSPLEEASRAAGYRKVFTADPQVGGRYSALTAFGLVPSGLAGADIETLLTDAEDSAEFLGDDVEDNVGLQLGAVLGGTLPLRDKIVFADAGSGLPGFADWAEQLIAESTGKLGTGLLPVVASTDAPELADVADDVLPVLLAPFDEAPSEELAEGTRVTVSGSLGSQLFVWEYAVAVAGRLLGINPFDQPDVEAAKTAARGMLDAQPEPAPAAFVDGAVEVRGDAGLLGSSGTVADALRALLATLPENGYLSVQAYLDRHRQADLESVRSPLAAVTGRPVTFGWGPRFLHSTGQYHKGGSPIGVYLQLTGAGTADLAIPDRPFTFGELISAQAAGDAQVLTDHGRPVLRLHLTDRAAGVAQLRDVISTLAASGRGHHENG